MPEAVSHGERAAGSPEPRRGAGGEGARVRSREQRSDSGGMSVMTATGAHTGRRAHGRRAHGRTHTGGAHP